MVDAATRTFASVNQEAERILGMSPEPGTTLVRYHEVAIYRRTDGEMYEGHERPLARALDRGEVVRAEEILLDRPGGGTTLVLVNATPIYSDDGKIVSAVAVLQDMTPLEELERQRNEFLAMVASRARWSEAGAHRLCAAAEETVLSLMDHHDSDSGPRRLLVIARADREAADLEFIAASGEGNLEDRMALAGEPMEASPERDVSLRLLRHFASTVHHQQYHDADIITIRVERRAE